MRISGLIQFFGLSLALASPLPQSIESDKTCKTEALTADTWKTLGVDKWFEDYAYNMTQGNSNNVQLFSSNFGAPNFFCGLDSFCNAGQPCLPVPLPAWYVLVAMQNWNSYMNSVNTAVIFASSIISMILPEIVTDFYPKPQDNITPLKDAFRMFNTVLGVVPLTGAMSTAGSSVRGGLNFLNTQLKIPTGTDQFLAWSQISNTMATVVQTYQKAVSEAVQTSLDANLLQSVGGMYSNLYEGQFLGVHQNFTQNDIQERVIETFKIRAVALALQAQRTFIYRFKGRPSCVEYGKAGMCVQEGSTWTGHSLLQLDRQDNGVMQNNAVDILISKYGLTQEDILIGPTKCYDANGQKQLTDSFGDSLPLDPKAECLFLVPTCDGWLDASGLSHPKADGYRDRCGNQGVPL
ncbi:hypothetical protein CcaCcLH18_10707 [Colletotrichum camelliae]|nr:hypothetical protein CcaCcLH18_10707 [Colletotrichum camelliae]